MLTKPSLFFCVCEEIISYSVVQQQSGVHRIYTTARTHALLCVESKNNGTAGPEKLTYSESHGEPPAPCCRRLRRPAAGWSG